MSSTADPIPPLRVKPVAPTGRRRRAAGSTAGDRGRALLMLLALGLVLAVAASATVIVGGRALVAALPHLPSGVDVSQIDDLDEAVEREVAFPSTVVAADGSVIGRFTSSTTHLRVAPDALPPVPVAAILASEDDGFWHHDGFDAAAIARAFVANVQGGGIEQGGSTITQQVAKLLFTGDSPTLERKVAELRTAIELERRFTKQEILSAYLNSVYFGSGAFGVEAAAHVYFRSRAADLTLSQAALLAGVIPAPSVYDPRSNPEMAEHRRLHVLDRLEQLAWFTPAEVSAARADPPVVHPPLPTIERFPYFLDYVRRYLLDVAGMSPQEIYGAGLRIDTTLQPHLQEAAREAVLRNLPDPEGPAAAVVVLDHTSGDVRALVGGRDFGREEVNLALGRSGGGSGRPSGSAFKPFVLAEALERGYSLQDRVPAPATYVPTTVTDAKPVHNYTRRGYGEVTLDEATRRSINTAYVALAEAIGVDAVAQRAIDAGVESLPEPRDVGPSLAIGAYETSPLELAAAYGAFAADGHRLHASPIVSVTPAATSLEDVPRGRGRRVMSTDTARLVTAALQGVVETGTATDAAFGRPVAAKTGTSNDYADAWLVGYSPQLVAATWVGYPAGRLPMHDVSGVSRVTGGSIPASIWRDVMSIAHEGIEPASFPPAPHRPPASGVDDETPPAAPAPPPTASAQATALPAATSTTKTPSTGAPDASTIRPAASTTTEPPVPTTTRSPSTTQPPTPTTTRPPSTTTTQPPTPTTTQPPSTTTTQPPIPTTTQPPSTTTTQPPTPTTTRSPSTTSAEPPATTVTTQRSSATTTAKPDKGPLRNAG